MEIVFNKGALPADDLDSFAVAGSQSADLDLQITTYEVALFTGIVEKATLVSIEIGANDFLNNLSILASNPSGLDIEVDAIVTDIIRNLRRGWLMLSNTHPNIQFIVWTIPDVTLAPAHFGTLTEREVANVRSHLNRANRAIKNLDSQANVAVVDVFALSRRFALNPPILFGHQLVSTPEFGNFDNVFADDIHPSAVGNALIANGIIRKINADFNDDIPFQTRPELATLAHIPAGPF